MQNVRAMAEDGAGQRRVCRCGPRRPRRPTRREAAHEPAPRTVRRRAGPRSSFLAVTALFATGNLEVVTQGGTAIGNRLWRSTSIPVTWMYNDPSTVGGCSYSAPNAPAAGLLPVIQTSFNHWQDDPDSTIAFNYGGTTAVTNVGADGVNVISFCDATVLASDQGYLARTPSTSLTVPMTVTAGGGCPAGQGLLDLNGNPPPAGYCFPVGTYPAGTIVDADVEYNTFGTNETFFTTSHTAGDYAVEAITTHELGHFFGLSHDPIPQATMFAFIDDEPASDGLGQAVLKRSDLSTAGRYYPAASYSSGFGSITGFISLDGMDADGVHVVAVDPNTLLGVAGRFSVSRFEDTLALGPEGPDFATNGTGFYRIDGLPPGNYYVYVEYFDGSDFISGRLDNRYNTTVGNSNVANGTTTSSSQSGGWLGFFPALTEFYNTGESGNGGDGVNPGTAADNSDAASLVSVSAGAVTSNINIAINIEPVNGQTAANRQNPTTRTVIANDAHNSTTDRITAFLLNGGNNDYFAVRIPSNLLPTPPYNIAEGVWMRAGKSTTPYVSMFAFEDPNRPGLPDMAHPVVPSAGRVISGGPNGATAPGDFVDVRDQWNVTVNQARTIFVVMNQPASPPGISFLTQGYFDLVTCRTTSGSCTGNRVGRTLITQDGGATWGTVTNADLFYDLILEADPPVMVTGASPSSLDQGQTADVTITGVGFVNGATVEIPDVTVNNVTYMSPTTLVANVTANVTGLTSDQPTSITVRNPDVVFPNTARLLTIIPSGDSDGDLVPDSQDCAPLDPLAWYPATEVTNVTITDLGATTQISWDSQDALNGTGTSYDVVTGQVTSLIVNNGYVLSSCGVNDQPDTPYVDSNIVGTGDARYWLVRATNSCNVPGGTYGDGSGTPDPRDALDAGSPCP